MGNEETLYELVKLGQWRIDSLGRVWKKRNGQWIRAEHRMPQGYLQVRKMVKGLRIHTGAHRLVYHHFQGPIPEGLVINHLNGKKDDNRPENLEIVTYSQNQHHAFVTGLANQDGERNPACKLTDQQVVDIRTQYAQGKVTQQELGDLYGVAFQTISDIVRGKRRKEQGGPIADYSSRRTSKPRKRNHKGQYIS